MSAPQTFCPDRRAYVQGHVTLAALAMAGGMGVLWLMGNPHIWTGAFGGLAAVAVRGWYLMSDTLAECWTLGDTALDGPAERHVPLTEIARVKIIGAAVQVITTGGDKHLIKFQSDPEATRARILSASEGQP